MAGVCVAGEVDAEGHCVGHHARVGAAADGDGIGGQAGHVVIDLEQPLNHLVIGAHIVYGAAAQAAHRQRRVGQLVAHLAEDLLFAGGQRIADVQRHFKLTAVEAHQADVAGQIAALLVLRGDAGALAVALNAEVFVHRRRRVLHAAVRADAHQRVEQKPRRVQAQLGHAGVRLYADRLDLRAIIAQVGHGELVVRAGKTRLQLVHAHIFRAHDGARRAGHNVHALARVDRIDRKRHTVLARALAGKQNIDAALFDVDQRIFRVGREAVIGHFHLRGIVSHAAHGHLLVAAEDQAHAVLQLDARVPHGAHGVERRDRRAFIVHHAAAIDAPVRHIAGEGIVRPAVAGGHNVQMRQHTQRLRALAQRNIARIAVEIAHGKAHLFRVGQRLIERLSHVLAERLALARRLDRRRIDRHPLLERLINFIAPAVDQRIDLFVVLFHDHFSSLSLCRLSYMACAVCVDMPSA